MTNPSCVLLTDVYYEGRLKSSRTGSIAPLLCRGRWWSRVV